MGFISYSHQSLANELIFPLRIYRVTIAILKAKPTTF